MKGNFHEKAVETGMSKSELKNAYILFRSCSGFQDFKTRFNLAGGKDRVAVLPKELIEYISKKTFK